MNRLYLGSAILLVVLMITISYFALPYLIARGTFGRTFLDKPEFSIVFIQLNKNATDCYIWSTVWNSGNVGIARLTLTLNGTYVWSDGWVGTNEADTNWQRFHNYGSFSCERVSVGQTYTASFQSEFADGVNKSHSMTVEVGPNPLPSPPKP